MGLAVWPLLRISSAQQSRSGASEIYDGFEEPSLSKAWDTSRFIDGAVRIQGSIVRTGHGAAEVTVHAGDKFEVGIAGSSDSERAELMEARSLVSKERTTYEYAFSMFFPETFPIVPTRLVIAQWKQYCPESRACSDDSPVLAIRYMSGVLRVTQDIGKKSIVLWAGSQLTGCLISRGRSREGRVSRAMARFQGAGSVLIGGGRKSKSLAWRKETGDL